MSYRHPSRAEGGAPPSTNETSSRVYSEVWGNIPGLQSLSLPSHAQSVRNADRYQGYGNQDTRKKDRREACRRFAPSAMSCYPPSSSHSGDRAPHLAQGQPPRFSAIDIDGRHTISRRHTDWPPSTAGVIGEAYGNTSISSLADGATYEQVYRDDPSLLPVRGASPRIPTNIDGAPQVIIGRVVGNFSSGPIGVNAKMKQVYEPPSRPATTANSPGSSASVVNSYTEYHHGGKSSRQGFSMIVPHHVQQTWSAPPGTFPFSGHGHIQGQSNGNQYAVSQRRQRTGLDSQPAAARMF
ncbi:hypothetical protein BKA70DRAFT_1441295 [Coprinopsis sp. MPI-PUGE-AT-0042]|nr:hypothetical protein BKA70DRAFT_1441295 [Coprinopsis sp. MPI-PUGE-AT-0042]